MTSFWGFVPPGLLLLFFIRQLGILLSNKLAEQDQLPISLVFCSLSLLCWPFSATQWTKLGNLWGDLKSWSQAKLCFRMALKLQPNWIEAHLGLGTALLIKSELKNNDWQAAEEHLLKAYYLRRGKPWNLSMSHTPLISIESPPTHQALQKAYCLQLEWLKTQVSIPEKLIEQAHPDKALYQEPARFIRQPLQACDTQLVTEQYNQQSGLAWYDNFLEPEALQQLLQFCQRSTFWHHHYKNAYLGAYLDDGFSSPLLYQIAGALKEKFPELLSDLHLIYMWSFKCHQQGKGVALHHDSAIVNVNFWLTPDQANIDPESGGLCVSVQQNV